ncbi:MAG: hypothetical protein V8Q07_05695 [Acutalibacteraceae bacterium]
MKFTVAKKEYDFMLKHFDCGMDRITNIHKDDKSVSFEVADDEMDDFQVDMTSDIIHNGMDNQDTVNQIGIEMYRIHDSLMYG